MMLHQQQPQRKEYHHYNQFGNMGKIIERTIDNFSGGMTNDLRSKDLSKFALASHFDAFTYPHKLVPRGNTEDKESGAYDMVKFLYADRGGTQKLFGFDKLTTGDRCNVSYWNGTAWVDYANSEGSDVDARNEDVFFHYKNYIYMWAGGDKLKRFDAYDSSDSWEEDVIANVFSGSLASYTTVVQPVHHKSDDIAYFFTDNLVHKLDDTVWTENVLTFPSDMKIKAACPYGNYLAIACVTKAGLTEGGSSTVFIWDRDGSLTTITERADFDGILQHIATLDGKLIAIVEQEDKKKIVVKEILGDKSKTINTITIDDSAVFYTTSQVVDSKLYFPMKAPLNSDNRLGIWAVDSNGKLSLDFIHDDATSYEGIFWTGDIWWIAHSNDGSVSRSTTGIGTPVYETLILESGEQNKKLLSVGVKTIPLAAQASTGTGIDLKYKTNNDTSWQTIFTDKGDRYDTFHEAINISGATLPEFKEIQFQILPKTASQHITGLKYKFEVIDDDLT